jgi:hypothetical protein
MECQTPGVRSIGLIFGSLLRLAIGQKDGAIAEREEPGS